MGLPLELIHSPNFPYLPRCFGTKYTPIAETIRQRYRQFESPNIYQDLLQYIETKFTKSFLIRIFLTEKIICRQNEIRARQSGINWISTFKSQSLDCKFYFDSQTGQFKEMEKRQWITKSNT